MNFTPTQEQLTILQEFNNHRVMKINAVAGSGKEQPVSTSTPTPYGIVPFGSLNVGDKVVLGAFNFLAILLTFMLLCIFIYLVF